MQYDGIYIPSVLVWLRPSGGVGTIWVWLVRGTVRCGMVCGVARYAISSVGIA